MGLTLRGLNHRQTPLPIPINRDLNGYVFFTRPQLNMTTQNLRAERKFIPLLDRNEMSLPRTLRRYLDPRLSPVEYPCPFVDDRQAFIPLLSNLLMTCTGWPDPTLDTFTSKPGVQGEVYKLVDSEYNNYRPYDLTITCRNMPGDPITALLDHWMLYSSRVFSGEMVPYPDFIAANEIDYNTRVYRLVMDKNRQHVQKIAATGASFPVSNPAGAGLNYDINKPLISANDELSFQLPSVGFMYNDPILVYEFNMTVAIFNPDMGNLLDGGTPQEHTLLKPSELSYMNSTGYPYLDPDTMELRWYVHNSEYEAKIAGVNRTAAALATQAPA